MGIAKLGGGNESDGALQKPSKKLAQVESMPRCPLEAFASLGSARNFVLNAFIKAQTPRNPMNKAIEL
jgi:hypothetical protein